MNKFWIAKEQQGYTLIELVMVMVIIAILSVAIMVSISSYKTQHLRAAADRILSDLNYAKNIAEISNKWMGITFSTVSNSYSLYETDGITDTTIKDTSNSGRDYTIVLANDYSGVIISSVNIGSGTKVEFNPRGMPFTDKTAGALGSNGLITLSQGNSSAVITIDYQSGRINIP